MSDYNDGGQVAVAQRHAHADAPPPPLRNAEVRLNDMLESVEMLTRELVDRIEPVLGPEHPSAVPGRGEDDPEAPASSLTSMLDRWTARLGIVNAQLRDAYERLEI